jgi:lysophospholipase L1-like esterase
MTRTIVCFGDSNTHGANPDQSVGGRLPREVRWPGVMRAALGEGYEVIEEGLNGRCTVWDIPIEPGRNSLTYLAPCLLSHRPVDLVIIMLGTNDTKRIYGMTASEIACGASALVDVAEGTLSGPDGTPPRVLLVAPVPLGEVTAHAELWGFGASREESRRLAGLYRLVAEGQGVGFFDAGSVAQVSPLDGVHLDPAAHASLGAAMADAVRAELAGESA